MTYEAFLNQRLVRRSGHSQCVYVYIYIHLSIYIYIHTYMCVCVSSLVFLGCYGLPLHRPTVGPLGLD